MSKLYKIGAKTIYAVKPFSLQINAGEVVCFLGPNGAGKTTTVKMLCRLVLPTSGDVHLDNLNFSQERQYLQQIGVVLEGARNIYWRLTPIENMILFCQRHGLKHSHYIKRIKYYLGILGLDQYKSTECRYLSKGNQQKVAIGCALSLNANLLLLDEPTLGLDIEIARIVMKIIKEEKGGNRIIVITTHDMELIENTADKIIFFKNGNHTMSTTQEVVCKYGNGDGRLSSAYLNIISGL